MHENTLPDAPAMGTAPGFPQLATPYPGLRPFQPEDSDYFFGRRQSVNEVVRRLRTERFVAVIGGSGSGKSSLVLAGAIPRLRGFGMEDTGDFWVPIVSTPGTNPVAGDSPLKRLARKFCAELMVLPEADARQRIEVCSDILREPGGLGNLVKRFGKEVRDLDGVSPENLEVNYLFLLDQFEEIFHRSNRSDEVAKDCAHLVARVVEQSEPPHRYANVCVALTMRSEHLNECPRYQNLPDAINRAFYLVRRLDDEQIRQAIQRPATRYLRNCIAAEARQARAAAEAGKPHVPTELPDSIVFEPDLLKRLETDTTAMLGERDHADYLPLLQHLLYWTWRAACERCGDAAVPDSLRLIDLENAVGTGLEPIRLKSSNQPNALKDCIENHCELIFKSHEDAQQKWKSVFRALAFKEPNTGTYTQQRAPMADLCKMLGLDSAAGFLTLSDLLAPWLEPHGYLHWDLESGTIKVAHETLIRRWERFREWTDADDQQFQLYLRLLDECGGWIKASEDKKADHLATGNALLMYEGIEFEGEGDARGRNAQFLRLLAMDREGGRLFPYANSTKDFIAASAAHRDQLKLAEQQRRDSLAAIERDAAISKARAAQGRAVAGGVLLVALVLLLISIAASQVSEKELTLHRSYALAAETQMNMQTQIGEYDQPQFALKSNIQAAQFFVEGTALRTGVAAAITAIPGIEGFERRLSALKNAELLAEARTITSLRTGLIGVPWEIQGEMTMNPPMHLDCGNAAALKVQTAKFFPIPWGKSNSGLLLTDNTSWGYTVQLAAARSTGAAIECLAGKTLFAVPHASGVKSIGVDQSLQNMVLTFENYTQYHVVNWSNPKLPRIEARAVVSQPDTLQGIQGLKSRRVEYATDFKVGERTVRLFDANPGPVPSPAISDKTRLKPAISGEGVCGAFVAAREAGPNERAFGLEPSGGVPDTQENRALCLIVTERPVNDGTTAYMGDLFTFPSSEAAKDRAKRLPISENIAFGAEFPEEIHANKRQGWLVFRAEDVTQWRGMFWTLDAWRRQARTVFKAEVAGRDPAGKVPEISRPYELIMHDVKDKLDAEKLRAKLPKDDGKRS